MLYRIFVAAVAISAVFVGQARAAEISFSPAAVALAPGAVQPVMLSLVPSAGERVNAFDIALMVPVAVNAASVTPVESAAVIWLTRPAFDEVSRAIKLKGGFTAPITTATPLARFMISASAAAKVSVAPTSAVLAADGRGTPLPLTAGQLVVTVESAPAGGALALSSPTHPEQTRWSKVQTWTIQWPAVLGASYAYTLTRAGEAAPVASGAATAGSVTFPNLADGIYTIAVRGQSPHGPAVSGQRMALIDATPPEPFRVQVERSPAIGDNKPFLVFETYDIMSGVAGYEIRRDISGPFQAAVSPYIINDPGVSQVTVRAIDRAGNVREETVQLAGGGSPWWLAALAAAALIIFSVKRKAENAKRQAKS